MKDGYERISFSELQPDFVNEPDKPIPLPALKLSGKKVFIKGYTHKYSQGTGKVDHFILVPDLGECCFGDKVTKPTHMIEVKIVNPEYRVSWGCGTLEVARRLSRLRVSHRQPRRRRVHYSFMQADAGDV